MKKILVLLIPIFLFGKEPKIIGLVPVRNEVETISQILKALSLFVDGIVVLDDASDDGTPDVIKSIAKYCKIEKLIEKKEWYRDEPGDANLMLQEGRQLGGTHFIRLDADEMFTANLLDDNWLRNKILELKPGDKYVMTWIQLWRSPYKYRFDSSVWSSTSGDFIFCDDGKCFYESAFIHTSRTPQNLSGQKIYLSKHKSALFRGLLKDNALLSKLSFMVDGLERFVVEEFGENLNHKQVIEAVKKCRSLSSSDPNYFNRYRNSFSCGVMHFQFVNWDCLLAKQAWYRCLEKIRNPNIDVDNINRVYGESKNEEGLNLREAPLHWFKNYTIFYDPNIFTKKTSWHKKQILSWLKLYGLDFFKDLDIWDISWH